MSNLKVGPPVSDPLTGAGLVTAPLALLFAQAGGATGAGVKGGQS